MFGRDFKAFFVLKIERRGDGHCEVKLIKLGVGDPEEWPECTDLRAAQAHNGEGIRPRQRSLWSS